MSGVLPSESGRKARPSEATPRDGHLGSQVTPPPLPGENGVRPPVAPPPAPRPLLRPVGEASGWITPDRYFRLIGPWFYSLIFHSILLIGLALCVSSQLTAGSNGSVSLIANPDDEFYDELLDSPFLRDEFALRDTENAATEFISQPGTAADQVYQELDVELTDDASLDPMPAEELLGALSWENLGTIVAEVQPSQAMAASRIHEAGTVEQAVGGVFGNVKNKLDQGDLMVVWLFDASISLVDDRQRVARELTKFFEEMKARESDDSKVFKHAAVAFGANVMELVSPTSPNRKIIDAVKNVPVDDSGVENVFSAVEWVVSRYAKRWKHELQVIVWADESGDDLARLERTIVICRRYGVSVSVVGPSAILGREIGTHAWTHGPTGRVFLLPVSRGPDSALPQRLRLPYWFEADMPNWDSPSYARTRNDVPRGHRFPPWYGGDQLEGLVSGFGPYGLVRLAIETGGSYTIFDRPSDRGPFRLEDMRPYLPDYRVADQILDETTHHPLREAVVGTAALTLQTLNLQVPRMDFFDRPPTYFSPAAFRENLTISLQKEQLVVRQTVGVTEQALAKFGPNGMENLYEAEELPRWKAWYDLTRGRLLAAKARCVEYDNACKLLAKLLQPNANYVVFGPSSEFLYPPVTRLLAEESHRLLERCVQTNPNTPWAFLAQRELENPLGIAVQQLVIPPPPPEIAQPAPPPRPATPAVKIVPPRL